MGFDLIVTTNRIPELLSTTRSRAERVVAETAHNIGSFAKQRAPVDTGRLKNSIQERDITPLYWEVGPVGVEYDIYVEYGTSRAPAQPYLTPAVEQARPAFEAAIARLIDG